MSLLKRSLAQVAFVMVGIFADYFGTLTAPAQAFDWTTIAGQAGTYGTNDGVNGYARFWNPSGITADGGGNIYIADSYNNSIRKLTAAGTNWSVSTLAGGLNHGGYTDGTNSVIEFNTPFGIAADDQGNLYVADTGAYTIRKLTHFGTDWVSSTIAGLGGTGPGTTDGTNNAVRFDLPYALALGKDGSLYVADTFNHTIRKLAPMGTNWVSSTIAGLGRAGGWADGTNHAARFYYPYGIATDSLGNVFVADTGNDTIRMLVPLGTNWITRTIGGLAFNYGSADGTNSMARFYNPYGIAVDGRGCVYVGDSGNDLIRKITADGTNWVTTTIGGSASRTGSTDGWGSSALFNFPYGLALDAYEVLYVSDNGNNTIRRGLGLPILQISPIANGRLILSWGAIPGQTFQLQCVANLAAG